MHCVLSCHEVFADVNGNTFHISGSTGRSAGRSKVSDPDSEIFIRKRRAYKHRSSFRQLSCGIYNHPPVLLAKT